MEKVGFLRSLFDINFKSFITRRVAKFLYAMQIVLLLLSLLVGMVAAIWYASIQSDPLYLAIGIVGLPLLTLLLMIGMRLLYEASIALVAIAENTYHLRFLNSRVGEGFPSGQPGHLDEDTFSRSVAVSKSRELTIDELELLKLDYEENPADFALSVLDKSDLEAWRKAGRPTLKPWISSGMPDFTRWLRGLS